MPLFKKPFLLAITFFLTASTLPAHADQSIQATGQSAGQSAGQSPVQTLLSVLASTFQPPEDDAPQQTVPAGSRDEARCGGDSASMRPLMPDADYGLTASERPALWMEMPDTHAQEVLLVFQTEGGDDYARAQLPIPQANDQGFVQFQLPETAKGLAQGENYHWTLSILCEGYLSPNDPLFSGQIKRVAPSKEVAQTLANTSVANQVAILQGAGYWYDMVSLLLQNQYAFSNMDALSLEPDYSPDL